MAVALTAQDILEHPRFAEAQAAHVDAIVALFENDRFVTRMMSDAGVIHFRGFLVGWHFAFDEADPATWATPGNLRRELVGRGLASPRRVGDMIARFLHAGYAVSSPSPTDRRTRILVPTDVLIAHDRDHLAAYHLVLLTLFPGRGYEWVLTRDEGAHRTLRAATVRDLPHALSAMTHAAMGLFLARDAGYLALLLAMQTHLAGRDGPTWTGMADVLGVSRSHLRELFAEAEAASYVRLPSGGRGGVAILPPLRDAYDRFIAGVAADQDIIAQAALPRGDQFPQKVEAGKNRRLTNG